VARLTDQTRAKILADFHIGKSQNWLAKEYQCSPATVNKLCKGVIPKYKDKVNAVVAINSDLSRESEYQSECFTKEVNELTRKANLVYGVVEKAIQMNHDLLKNNKVVDRIGLGEGVQAFRERKLNTADIKNIIESTDKASVTLGVNQRHANQNINVNTQTNMQNNQNIALNKKVVTEALLEFDNEY